MSHSAIPTACIAAILCCALATTSAVAKPSYTTFEIAGATALYATSLNDNGVVLGRYITGDGHQHGFLRSPDGTVTSFDPDPAQTTQPLALNNNGDATGWYYNGTIFHAFLRTSDGNITTIDPPGASEALAEGINNNGAITGTFEPGNHGFLRTSDGSFTSFDAPGATETQTTSVNGSNEITGYYYDKNGVNHGFIRANDGSMTSFNVGQNNYEITPTGINNNEVVIGYFTNYENSRTGFIREGSGKIKTFTLPKAVVVLTENITDSGLFAGTYYDKSWVRKLLRILFLRSRLETRKTLKRPAVPTR